MRVLGNRSGDTGFSRGVRAFILFGVKQAWVSLFGGLMLLALLLTHWFYPADAVLPRYDFLTLLAIAIQCMMLRLGLETWDEVAVILLFHVAGTAMEVFKTAVGSWVYPEASYLHIGGVPLFSGFMYASVGSYIARACRAFDLRFTGHPGLRQTGALTLGIYANFFLHHYWIDCRYVLMLWTAFAFRRCMVYFRIGRTFHRMPMLLSFVLIALFIWFSENLGTFSHAWLYPSQRDGWSMVSIHKLGAWFMLTIMSYVIVTLVKRPVKYVA
ncbi:DUF817 domain-containing protein [Robbsia sp. KACC 23696]|uniref:DUF817 domain-containing protein n=1 Tax=Robbsia sp. KACC 23696 TaxID=3149231 RepID=UPI00325C1615